jgi:hypothetical protein
MTTSALPARPGMPGTDLFRPKVLNFNLARGGDPTATTFPLASKENESLSLAERERFDVMCSKIPWGSEDREAFGEMLRSLVITFLPQDVFHLHLLRNVASLQWQLYRIEAIQHNLFTAGAEEVGAHNLPAGTNDALEFQTSYSNLLRDLQRALAIYKTAKKK